MSWFPDWPQPPHPSSVPWCAFRLAASMDTGFDVFPVMWLMYIPPSHVEPLFDNALLSIDFVNFLTPYLAPCLVDDEEITCGGFYFQTESRLRSYADRWSINGTAGGFHSGFWASCQFMKRFGGQGTVHGRTCIPGMPNEWLDGMYWEPSIRSFLSGVAIALETPFVSQGHTFTPAVYSIRDDALYAVDFCYFTVKHGNRQRRNRSRSNRIIPPTLPDNPP